MADTASFDGNIVSFRGHTWSVEYPVRDVRINDDLVLVLYEYWRGPKHRQLKNLEAFDESGQKVWTAEHPTNQTTDAYVDFQKNDPFTLVNFAGFECEIDPATGKLARSKFAK